MSLFSKAICGFFVILVAGCAETSVTPISRNEVIISTSAAPACGRTGAARVASQMAAVETLRRGFERYVVLGAQSQNNVRAITTGPTSATTTGTFNTFGNTTTGNSTTTFGGSQTIFTGSNDADLRVLMLNRGERGFQQGIDARQTLGPDWQKLVADGINSCS